MNDTVKELLGKVKATAGKAGEAAGRTLDQAGKKAGELWEITRLNLQMADLQRDIDEVLRKIGKIVYSAHLDPNANTEEVEGMLTLLDGMKSEMSDIRQRIKELRQIKACPSCEKKLNKEDAYCRHCGTKL